MYKLFLSLALLIISGICIAQRDVEKAIKMGAKYPESDVYITNDKVDFYLEYNKPDQTVIAIQKEQTDLISLNSDVYDVFFKDYIKNASYIEYARFNSEINSNCRIYNSNYSSNDIFHDDVKQKVIEIYFKQRGDYKSFITKKRFLDLKYVEPIYLANYRPTEEKTIKLSIENELEFDILEFNFDKFQITKKYEFDDKNNLHKYEYKILNPPFVADKDGIRGISHYLPHILIIPKSYKSKKHNQEYFKDVYDLYKWYSSLIKSIEDDSDQLAPFLETLINDSDTDLEKIKKIYYWVQLNIRYIAFEDGIAGFKPEAAQTVFNKKYGDCKGIANLTKQLLIQAGFDARLAWIGTNSRAYDYSVPSLIVDNHMICALFYNDSIYYLDATEKFMPFGVNAERIQNKQALIEDGDNFMINKIPSFKSSNNKMKRNTSLKINENAIAGKSNINYSGETNAYIKAYLNTVENDKKDKVLKDLYDSKNIEINNIEYSEINHIDSVFNINFDFVSSNSVMKFDDELYIKFENYFEFINSEIDTSFLFDYDLNYKREINSKTLITIPENYSVDFLPESISYKTDDFIIEANFEVSENRIIYNKNIKILNGLIHHSQIDAWNNAIEKLIEIYNSNIILKKV